MSTPSSASVATSAFDEMLDKLMVSAVSEARLFSRKLAGMISYHMGWVDRTFAPVDSGSLDRGKRIRPRLATLTCRAVAGDDERSRDLAAGIELLHNFTLVHDDIQDQSHLRRHRPTVWSLWGTAQAINTGDAMYAASRRALLGMRNAGVSPERTLKIADDFDRVAIEIVAGQVTDLEFEGGHSETVEDYLRMIGMKTAAIVRFAAWAGAYAGGATAEIAEAYGRFGWALGIGFQIRDDILGIWASAEETGKPAADDIRRRKQSLPIIELRGVADPGDRAMVERVYGKTPVTVSDVDAVLAALDSYGIRASVEARVGHYHDEAETILDQLGLHADAAAVGELRSFVKTLALRTY